MGPLNQNSNDYDVFTALRCVRFATEIAGVPEIGAIGRGEDMEITTYLEKSMESELSANMLLILCPCWCLNIKTLFF